MDHNEQFLPGEVVYMILRNPHTQNVAQVMRAAVVQSLDNPYELALFANETYYPLTDELTVFKSEADAEKESKEALGERNIIQFGDGNYYG